MTGEELAIGSRGSVLAMAQATLVREAFLQVGRPSRIVVIETEGDRRAPDTAWGEGAFVAAIERALLAGDVDVAVHSAKDVPTDEDPRLHIAAYLPRADPRDALVVRNDAVARRLADLPLGSRVGTDSPRRTGFLLARRPDLDVHALHGNVDTRLRRLDEGETDALVLACAGLDRLGLGDRIAERLEPETVPPAPGQGAIAVQVRRDDGRVEAITAAIDDQSTRAAVEAERAFLSASGGGCRAPVGALATVADGRLDLLAGYASVDGADTALARRHGAVEDGEALARALAGDLDSYARIRPPIDGSGTARPRPRVLVTRAADQASALVSALRDAGFDPVVVPTIAVELTPPGGALDAAAQRLQTYAWVVVTSPNGARAVLEAAERTGAALAGPAWAAIGPGTRGVLETAGVVVDFLPGVADGRAVAAELPVLVDDRVLVVRGDLAGDGLARALRARGARIDDITGYRTHEAPATSRPLLRRALADGQIDVVVFTSGSTVRGLVALDDGGQLDRSAIRAVCIGLGTAAAARVAGFEVLAVASTPEPRAIATATADALAATPKEIR